MKRVTSIDIARGLVMVIMALDHSRDLLHVDALTQNPCKGFLPMNFCLVLFNLAGRLKDRGCRYGECTSYGYVL